VHRNDFYDIVLSGSTMLIDNKAPEIVNNDDKDDDDDDDDDDGDRDGDDDERIDEVKNVNADNSDGRDDSPTTNPKAGSRRPSKQRNIPWEAGGLLAGRQLETRRIKKMEPEKKLNIFYHLLPLPFYIFLFKAFFGRFVTRGVQKRDFFFRSPSGLITKNAAFFPPFFF
jgi:hypothetical protein